MPDEFASNNAQPEVSNQDDNVHPAQSDQVQQKQPEKMLSQAEVNRLVGKTRVEERARMEREFERRQANKGDDSSYSSDVNSAPYKQNNAQQEYNDQQRYSRDDIRAEIERLSEEKRIQEQQQVIANDFIKKVNSSKEKYEDFDEVTKNINIKDGIMGLDVGVAAFFNQVDNAGDVFYECCKNPAQLSKLLSLSPMPELAKVELMNISNAIKANENALKQRRPNPPPSKMKVSPTNVDNGVYTVSDYRKMDWLRD